MKKKLLCLVCAILLCFPLIVGCGNKGGTYRLKYYDELDDAKGYNKELFYENDMEAACADPTCIYIDDETDEENYGWFYLYPTSDSDFGCHGFSTYRSRDMKSWEYVGPIFDPKMESWAHHSCWAPEVIYDKDTKKYYLFFSAEDYNNPDGLIFENNEDKAYYRKVQALIAEQVKDKSKEQAIDVYEGIMNDMRDMFAETVAGEEAADGRVYTQAEIDKAIGEIDAIDRIYKKDKDGNDTSELDVDATHNAFARGAQRACTPDIATQYNNRDFGIGVAVSDSPKGPFTQYTNVPGEAGYNEKNRTIGIDLPFIAMEDTFEYLMYRKSEFWKGPADDADYPGQLIRENASMMIDVHPYVDPKTNQKYLYLVGDPQNNPAGYIFVVKMGEKWTDDPQWETITRLTRCGYYTTDDMSSTNRADGLTEGTINEGPYVYYNKESDKYYLTYSVNGYQQRAYAVVQAISDSPMGPFRKLSLAEGGKVTAAEQHWDHISGPGHHSFCEYDGQLYIIYHGHYDRKNELPDNSRQRGSCVDPIVWIKNGNGETIMHCNGPTYSYQPKIGPDMKYKNIATQATVKTDNTAKDSDAKYLNDNVIRIYSWDEFLTEFVSGTKKQTTITLTFDEYRTVRALMVYNTWDYEYHWEEIAKVEFDFKKTVNGKELQATALIENLKYDVDRYINKEVEGEEFMRPGAAAIAEFDEMEVKEIRITFKHDKPISVSEIYVLGK